MNGDSALQHPSRDLRQPYAAPAGSEPAKTGEFRLHGPPWCAAIRRYP